MIIKLIKKAVSSPNGFFNDQNHISTFLPPLLPFAHFELLKPIQSTTFTSKNTIHMIIIAILLIVALIGVFTYNSLIAKKNAVDNAFSSIDAMLKKRYDLIPNLVETVKQYMSYEKDTITKVVELRSKVLSGNIASEERVQIEKQISGALRNIMVSVENYPDLKASQNFVQLQGAWNEIEEQISAARRAYNAAVLNLNNAVEQFPSSIFAGMMNVSKRTFFEIAEAERQNVKASDLFKS